MRSSNAFTRGLQASVGMSLSNTVLCVHTYAMQQNLCAVAVCVN